MDLKELESGVDPKIHWYYQSKKIPLLDFVRKVFRANKKPVTLIDVGSGSGFFMYELVKEIPEMIEKVWLVDIGYSETEVASTKSQLVEKSLSLPDKIENAIVVMMDVLEHLEDDHAMMRMIKERSVGENHFFITAPAFMSLWSGHDVYLGHYRRYTKKTLQALVNDSHFTSQHLYYIYGTIFPLVWVARKMEKKTGEPQSDMKPTNPLVNSILKGVCSVEMSFRRMNVFAGVTCVSEGKI